MHSATTSFSTFFLTVGLLFLGLPIAALAASDAPPACLLGALQTFPDPGDFKAVCGDLQASVEGNLTKACTDSQDLANAFKVYADTCKQNADVTVSSLPSSATAGVTATSAGASGSSATATGASGTASGSAASPTGTGTGAAGLTMPQLQLLSGLVGLVGVMLL